MWGSEWEAGLRNDLWIVRPAAVCTDREGTFGLGQMEWSRGQVQGSEKNKEEGTHGPSEAVAL